MLLTVTCFTISSGVIEGFVIGSKGLILAFGSIPYPVVLFPGLITKWL